jgi:hypothetical protein
VKCAVCSITGTKSLSLYSKITNSILYLHLVSHPKRHWTHFHVHEPLRMEAQKKATSMSSYKVFFLLLRLGSRYSDSLRAGRSGDRVPVGARFSAPVQTGPGTYPASCTMGTGSFPEVKQPGLGVDHPPPSSTKVRERVELYLYYPSGPSWPVLGWTLPLPWGWQHYTVITNFITFSLLFFCHVCLYPYPVMVGQFSYQFSVLNFSINSSFCVTISITALCFWAILCWIHLC